MEGKEGMCGCERLFTFLTHRLQKLLLKECLWGPVTDNSFSETTVDYLEWLGLVLFGSASSYIPIILLAGLCADCDRGTMLIKKRAQKQEITCPLVPQTCLTTCLGSAFRPLSQFGLSDLRESL